MRRSSFIFTVLLGTLIPGLVTQAQDSCCHRCCGQEPFLRQEFYDAGVLIRLRYQTIPADRQKISSEIVDLVLKGFTEHYPRVRFGYPHSVVRYRREDDEAHPTME